MGVSQLQYMLYLRETGCPGLRTACSVIGKEIMKMRWNGLTSSDLKSDGFHFQFTVFYWWKDSATRMM